MEHKKISDNETIDNIVKLGGFAPAYYQVENIKTITEWWTIKAWLWNEHKFNVDTLPMADLNSNPIKEGYSYCNKWGKTESIISKKIWDSPIDAEKNGLKNAILFLMEIKK